MHLTHRFDQLLWITLFCINLFHFNVVFWSFFEFQSGLTLAKSEGICIDFQQLRSFAGENSFDFPISREIRSVFFAITLKLYQNFSCQITENHVLRHDLEPKWPFNKSSHFPFRWNLLPWTLIFFGGINIYRGSINIEVIFPNFHLILDVIAAFELKVPPNRFISEDEILDTADYSMLLWLLVIG